jgi:G3E family GTPase
VGYLLWESGFKILRIKGVFCLKANPFVLELQGVEDLFEIKDTKTAKTVYAGESRVLLIGEELPSGAIRTLLRME